jgi:N-acetyl sugar amidotransferase
MSLRWCPVCVLPSTRPEIRFDERGNCNCRRGGCGPAIDWEERRRAFEELVQANRGASSSPGWDCVVPVSGGKDSTWQVVTCLRHGLKPLAVSWRPPGRTRLGRRNLRNLVGLGVDHIDFSVDPRVERRFSYRSLVRVGSPAVPMHMAIWSIPLTVAVRFGIGLVVYGENSALEYGGPEDLRRGRTVSAEWLRRYGGTFGTTAADWVGEDLSPRDLTPYFAPDQETLSRCGVRALFLGAHFPWDPEATRRVARAHGFREAARPRTGLYAFADIDDSFISIHHFIKWYKFGFTRLFDNLSIEIRAGRMTRAEALERVRQAGDQTPHRDIARYCAWAGITVDHFYEVIEPFRNRDIWERRDGRWVIRDFILPRWPWPADRATPAGLECTA